MDIESLRPWIESARSAMTFLRAAKELLPKGNKRDEAERLLKEAEDSLKRADARLGWDLGFPPCKRCWPPEIMLIDNDSVYRCKNCHLPNPEPPPLRFSESEI